MTENNEVKDVTEENVSLAPHVNEKLKYCLLVGVAVLCIIAALAVVFSPEARQQREERKTKPESTAFVYHSPVNT